MKLESCSKRGGGGGGGARSIWDDLREIEKGELFVTAVETFREKLQFLLYTISSIRFFFQVM